MKILVINSGSSSIKYQLIEAPEGKVFAKGLVERIGINEARLKHKNLIKSKETILNDEIPDHTKGLKLILKMLLDKEHGVLNSLSDICAVGHRVVHGGNMHSDSVIIDGKVIEQIKEYTICAPLHNPANLLGIEASQTIMPDIKNIAVFDTAFHQTMPEESYIYALPYSYYTDMKIRRYGFHGISHKYLILRLAEVLNKDINDLKIITCHLGNGASLTAINNGKSLDTSLGFGTMCGLPMGTRTGDIDPAILLFLLDNCNMSFNELNELLYKKGGMFGLSGITNDMRDIEDAAEKGDAKAQLALNVYVHNLKKYIGAYAAIMNGLDVIIFTAGVGENSPYIREKSMENMEYLGINLDKKANDFKGQERTITTKESKVLGIVIPTNEELMIAIDTYRLVK